MICIPYQKLSGCSNTTDEMDVASGTYGRKGEVYTGFCWEMSEREHLEDLGVDGSVMLKCTFKKSDGRVWPGLIWLGMGTADRFL